MFVYVYVNAFAATLEIGLSEISNIFKVGSDFVKSSSIDVIALEERMLLNVRIRFHYISEHDLGPGSWRKAATTFSTWSSFSSFFEKLTIPRNQLLASFGWFYIVIAVGDFMILSCQCHQCCSVSDIEAPQMHTMSP